MYIFQLNINAKYIFATLILVYISLIVIEQNLKYVYKNILPNRKKH